MKCKHWSGNSGIGIQIYQAVRRDSENYISEEDWHITIFLRGEAPRKNILPVPPKIAAQEKKEEKNIHHFQIPGEIIFYSASIN